jgi:acyl phosphate:glycerol-3-phosphate acyltransferase
MRGLLFVCLGYLAGSVPFAVLIARRRAGVDIRDVGSGNPGATNVRRIAGLPAAVATMVLDAAKGALPVLLATWAGAGETACAAAGFAAVVGHVFPVWNGGRGGKGVSTALGMCLACSPIVAAVAAVVFVAVVAISRMVSLGSVVAACVLAPAAAVLGLPMATMVALCGVSALVVLRHRANLARVFRGTERRL